MKRKIKHFLGGRGLKKKYHLRTHGTRINCLSFQWFDSHQCYHHCIVLFDAFIFKQNKGLSL